MVRVACALVVMLLLPSLSRSDEADEVSTAVLDSVAEHLPPGAESLTQRELRDVIQMIRSIHLASYYPIELPAAKSAISKAVADASSSIGATAWSLARTGISATLESIGHGAQLLPAEKSKVGERPASPWISARQVGSLRVISMPRLEAPPGSLCSDLLNEPTTEDYRSIVLDLRGNEGGHLNAIPNIASHFLDPDQPLFRVELKKQTEEYFSRRCGPAPLKLPLAVLIDERTDSGGLLLAAVLQAHRRAILIGQVKVGVNGSIYNLYVSRGGVGALEVKMPVGELVLSGNRRLADAVRVDVAVPSQDEEALLQAARQSLGASTP